MLSSLCFNCILCICCQSKKHSTSTMNSWENIDLVSPCWQYIYFNHSVHAKFDGADICCIGTLLNICEANKILLKQLVECLFFNLISFLFLLLVTIFSMACFIYECSFIILCLKKVHTFWTCINSLLFVGHSFFSSSAFLLNIFILSCWLDLIGC